MPVQNSQVRSENNSVTSKGEFTQVPNEMLEYLMGADLTKRELRICIFLIRELTGWNYKFKPIEIEDIVRGTNLIKQNIMPALASLVIKRGLIKKIKLPGYRTPLYGFNEEIIGRAVANNTPRKFFESKGKVIDLHAFKIINSIPAEIIESMTEKRRLSAIVAAERASKYTLNTPKYTLKEISEFLSQQKKQTRERWEVIIEKILATYPNDEWLLWKAIDLVQKTQQDLFGNPIRKSVIGLFQGDWAIMRVAMEAKINQAQLEAEKNKKREENEKRLQAMKEDSPPVDISRLAPQWQKYAMRSTHK